MGYPSLPPPSPPYPSLPLPLLPASSSTAPCYLRSLASSPWPPTLAPTRPPSLVGSVEDCPSLLRPCSHLGDLCFAAADAADADRPPRVLLIFSGPCDTWHCIAAQLTAAGAEVTTVDTALGGPTHDVLGSIGDVLVAAIASGEYDLIFLAPPCQSYSVRHRPKLRSQSEPDGITPAPLEWARYLEKHNAIGRFCARAIEAAVSSGTDIGLENPADRGEGSLAAWTDHADHGSIWRTSHVGAALRTAQAEVFTFAMCSFGAAYQKWTSIAATGRLASALAFLHEERCRCQHGRQRHSELLSGLDEFGMSRATRASAYPMQLSGALCTAFLQAISPTTPCPRAAPPTAAPAAAGAGATDGRVALGPGLGARSAAACERARHVSLRFASPHSLWPAPLSELCAAPFPTDLRASVVPEVAASSSKAMRRRPLLRRRGGPAPTGPPQPPAPARPRPQRGAAHEDEPRAPGAPDGDISIDMLFVGDAYESEVQSWLRLADAAAREIVAGRRPTDLPPTRVLGQEYLQPWARDIVWDCRDRARCRPVRRSDRNTVFPGARQVNRAAIRRVAALLDWPDTDIVNQIGEGGIEPRSSCALEIVLAFHHESLLSEVAMAQKRIDAELGEQWVAPLSTDLPFVPCRLQPRGVVLQARTRVGADGAVEEYMKPRITSDSSFGGPDSVNAGVHDLDRAVKLPSPQQLGRGWGICLSAFQPAHPRGPGDPEDLDDPAGGGAAPSPPRDGPTVQGYCIDAESAYSFCPIQEADLWTQAFVWWSATGRAGFTTDYRLGFGGAFGPNRFERISTMAAAYSQHLQAEFDLAQPEPAIVRAWAARRAQLQASGDLVAGDAQLHARYLQVFIDDFLGTAGTDPVAPLDYVSHISFDGPSMRAAGCVPAPADSRVYVHAQIVVWALADIGLYASPPKCHVGSPLIGLGLRFDAKRERIDCPPTKQSSVLADAAEQLSLAAEAHEVERARARRLVGRLCSLSQVAPPLRPLLHGGYALDGSSAARRQLPRASAQRHDRSSLTEGGAAESDWMELLAAALELIEANVGVPLAAQSVLPHRLAAGGLTSVTDASGEDGFGGYAFAADAPEKVFILSEFWPANALSALLASADEAQAELRRRGSHTAVPHLPMPAAELFTAVLLPLLVHRSLPLGIAYAVGDCMPAVYALESLYSKRRQMRTLVTAARDSGIRWAPAHVPRDFNVDADRLSHPAGYAAVAREAADAGYSVERLRPSAEDWDLLARVIADARVQASGRPRKQRRRSGGDRPPS